MRGCCGVGHHASCPFGIMESCKAQRSVVTAGPSSVVPLASVLSPLEVCTPYLGQSHTCIPARVYLRLTHVWRFFSSCGNFSFVLSCCLYMQWLGSVHTSDFLGAVLSPWQSHAVIPFARARGCTGPVELAGPAFVCGRVQSGWQLSRKGKARSHTWLGPCLILCVLVWVSSLTYPPPCPVRLEASFPARFCNNPFYNSVQ